MSARSVTRVLFRDFVGNPKMREVPDPYYGGDDGFAEVVTMLEAASTGLQDAISKHHNILGHGRQG